jgi:hypothetical protein
MLLGGHAVAAAALATLPVPWFAVIPALALVGWSCVRNVRRHGTRNDASAVIRVARGGDEAWTLVRRDGRVDAASLRAGSFAHPLLLVLNFKTELRGNVSVVILTGGTESDELRRLRARLRWTGSSAE